VQLSRRYDDDVAVPQVFTGITEKDTLEGFADRAQPVVSICRRRHNRPIGQAPQHKSSEFDLTSGFRGGARREAADLAFAAHQDVQLPSNVDQFEQPVLAEFI
jgi:hypothetical protein